MSSNLGVGCEASSLARHPTDERCLRHLGAADAVTAGYAEKNPKGGYSCSFQYGPHILGCHADSLKTMGPVVNAASLKAWRH
jgi:hypothetical protein